MAPSSWVCDVELQNEKEPNSLFLRIRVCVRERERERERTFMLDVREWGGVEQMRLQMKMTQKEEARLLGFCMMRFGEMPCVFFFLGFGFFPRRMGPRPNP